MLIIDRTQRTWATLSAVVCVVAGAVYFCYANWSANGPSGGSILGLMFGSIAAVMMIFAGLLGARRRFPSARIGSAQFWMKGHLWIGTLTVPFALFHAGFGLGGRVEILLWILFFIVILSGFWGLLLQQMVPRMMFENLPRETFLEQIPHLCNRFTAESDCRLAEACGPLEVTISPVELKQFAVHWQPHFEEDRKKNRNDYPKTASDTEHFQKFLTKVYVGIPVSAAPQTAEVPQTDAASAASPVMKSVAHVKAPAVAPTATATSEAPVAHPKPDPRALLAAAKAKAAGAGTAAVANETAPADGSSPVATNPVAPTKPDPRAMLAAAKARKAMEGATSGTPKSSPSAAESAPATAKLDPKALLAAARAKKAAAEAATATPESTAPPPVEPPAAAAPAKPDPQAILAAARAKKAAAEAAQTTPELTATESSEPSATTPAKPNPKAMLAAAKAKREAAAAALAPAVDLTPEHTAAVSPASVEPTSDSTKPKADPRAMLAAAKAKREAAEAATAGTPEAAPHPVAEATSSIPAVQAPAGKPDPKAMMAAMKARKEAAAQQASTAPAVTPPAAKANPLAQLKTVKEPPASTTPTLVAAAKVAPPTVVQIKELKLFYLELIRPQLPLQPNTQSWRDAIRRSIMVCQIRSDNQHPQFIPIFDYLLDLCEQRRQFAMVQRYHAWLHGWLLVHIPVTVALYVVLLVHAIVALRVIPFGN